MLKILMVAASLTAFPTLMDEHESGAADVRIVQSGEEVVMGDFSYIMVRKDDWERLTNTVAHLSAVAAKRWTIQHSTESGRREWHGSPRSTEVDTDAKVKRTVYADGYIHEEAMKPVAPNAPRTRPAPSAPRPSIPLALQRKREAQAAQKPRTVNAVFSAGGKVEKVQEDAR